MDNLLTLATFKDDQYQFKGIKEVRPNARAVIINTNNEVFVEYITRDDVEFGESSYIELPGGGVKSGEDLIACLKREIVEECGLNIEIIKSIGAIEDDYNAICRHNISNYFLTKIISKCPSSQEEYETRWIKDMKFLPLDEIIKIQSNPENKISKLVYRREKVIIEKVKELLGK